MAAITIPTTHTLRMINPPARPWLHTLRHFSPTSFSLSTATSAAASSSTAEEEENSEQHQSTPSNSPPKPSNKNASFYPKRGQTLELVCETLAFKAKGVCKVPETGFVLMCDRALPGERFIGRVTRKKGSYAEVAKLKTLSPHQDAVDAPCKYASYCGGCKTQNLSYEAQLKYKEQQVWDLVLHVGKFSDAQSDFHSITKPIIPCANQFHYRNKMEFSFSNKRWIPQELWEAEQGSGNDYALGLHAPGFFDKILNIDKCLLQSEPANAVLLAVQDCWRDQSLGLSPYNVHTHAGFLKHLVIRTGSAKSSQTSHSNESIDLFWNQTNLDIRDDKGCPDIYRDVQSGKPEIMVNFVTSEYKPELLEPLVEKVSAITEVASVVNNINTSVGSTSVGEKEHVLYGKATIAEVLRGLMFQISANSFFQTNTQQAEALYELIENVAGLKGDGSEYVLDLFCGTGTIGLTLARRAKHVYGYEVVPQAIADARRNADLNGICNATFVQGDLNKIDENFGKNFPRPDVVISDPNRPGMHMKLIKFLLKLKAPRIVYVSCNPATCARDLDYLCHGSVEQKIEGCYQLRSIQPVDMFPHTPHIECVCLLDLNR